MKANKWFLLFLAVCLVFSLAACGGGGGGSDTTADNGNGDDPAGGGGEPAIPVSDNYLCFTANEKKMLYLNKSLLFIDHNSFS